MADATALTDVVEFFGVPDLPTLHVSVCGDCGALVIVGARQKHTESHGKGRWIYGD
jgi:hypothetical protein